MLLCVEGVVYDFGNPEQGYYRDEEAAGADAGGYGKIYGSRWTFRKTDHWR